MRPVTIQKDSILEAAIQYVADNGLENTSARKIAAYMSISDRTIFRLFDTKENLLTQCLYYVDGKIDAELHKSKFNLFKIKDSIAICWYAYFDYLVSHGSYTKFYRQFRHSTYYTPEVIAGQDQSFSFFANIVQKNVRRLGIDPDIFWVFMIETTLNFAVRVVDKQLPDDEKARNTYYRLITQGASGLIRKSKLSNQTLL